MATLYLTGLAIIGWLLFVWTYAKVAKLRGINSGFAEANRGLEKVLDEERKLHREQKEIFAKLRDGDTFDINDILKRLRSQSNPSS